MLDESPNQRARDPLAYQPRQSLIGGEDEELLTTSPEHAELLQVFEDMEGLPRQNQPRIPISTVWDEAAAMRFRRAVVLGDPGSGKTWLLRYEARRLARAALQSLRDKKNSLEQIVLPLFMRLPELSRDDDSIEAVLVQWARGNRSEWFGRLVREKLETGNCVLLLDAWDEVPVEAPDPGQQIAHLPGYRQRLGQRLDEFARRFSQLRILLTSRLTGYGGKPIIDAKELELLAFDEPQIEHFVHIWFGQDDRRAQRLLSLLKQNHQIRGLARIPLMLSLLCRAYQEREASFPTRRQDLYEHCLKGLLLDWRKQKGDWTRTPAHVEAVFEMLRDLAFELHVKGNEQFPEKLVRERVRAWLKCSASRHELDEHTPTQLIEALKLDGILIATSEGADPQLLFLHRTFGEYLAACWLAERVNRAGWNTTVVAESDAPRRRATVRQFVSKKAWDPRWREVITILAGLLIDPVPLLDMLADPRPRDINPTGDDLFRQRLALAAMCLPELRSEICLPLMSHIARITTELWSVWWNCVDSFVTGQTVAHLYDALPSIVLVHKAAATGCVGESLLEALSRALRITGDRLRHLPIGDIKNRPITSHDMLAARATPEAFVRMAKRLDTLRTWSEASCLLHLALLTVATIGTRAGTPEILVRLIDLLRSPDLEVAITAANTLGTIGCRVTPEVLSRITTLLRVARMALCESPNRPVDEREPKVRSLEKILAAVGAIGASAATPELLTELAELLRCPQPTIRRSAFETVKRVGSNAATSKILSQLAECLRDRKLSFAANEALRRIGIPKAPWEFILRLAALLDHSSDHIWLFGVGVGCGTSIVDSEKLAKLAALLADTDEQLRWAAAWLVGRVGALATTPEILSQLSERLVDSDASVRLAAKSALRNLGHQAATPSCITGLAERLHNPAPDIRIAALEALSLIGATAATPQVLDRLAALVRDSNALVRREAMATVGTLGRAATTPAILVSLAQRLHDLDVEEWYVATCTIANLGSSTEFPIILEQLTERLGSGDKEVKLVAAQVVSKLGGEAVTPEILTRIAKLLDDPDEEIRLSATRAVRDLGNAAVRSDIVGRLGELLDKSVEDKLLGFSMEANELAEAMCALGLAAARPLRSATLIKLLDDLKKRGRSYVRRNRRESDWISLLSAIPECMKVEGHWPMFASRLVSGWSSQGLRFFKDTRGPALKASGSNRVIPRILSLFGHATWYVHTTVELSR